jgi:chemotaxis signal transduction protein
MIQEENSGLTVVHPVDRIKEVVEIEWQRINNLNVQSGKTDSAIEAETAQDTTAATV